MTAIDHDFMSFCKGLAGENFAIRRFLKYDRSYRLIWKLHDRYKKHEIWRAFRETNQGLQPCALYKIETYRTTLVSVNLAGIKEALKIYLGDFDE